MLSQLHRDLPPHLCCSRRADPMPIRTRPGPPAWRMRPPLSTKYMTSVATDSTRAHLATTRVSNFAFSVIFTHQLSRRPHRGLCTKAWETRRHSDSATDVHFKNSSSFKARFKAFCPACLPCPTQSTTQTQDWGPRAVRGPVMMHSLSQSCFPSSTSFSVRFGLNVSLPTTTRTSPSAAADNSNRKYPHLVTRFIADLKHSCVGALSRDYHTICRRAIFPCSSPAAATPPC